MWFIVAAIVFVMYSWALYRALRELKKEKAARAREGVQRDWVQELKSIAKKADGVQRND